MVKRNNLPHPPPNLTTGKPSKSMNAQYLQTNSAGKTTQTAAQSEPVETTREAIGDTTTVLLALFGILAAGLMVGRQHGEIWPLHPVWRVLIALAGLGIVGSYVRLVKLKQRLGNGE